MGGQHQQKRARRCICHDIRLCCECVEWTRTRDGVCDMCLFGIHVNAREGERMFPFFLPLAPKDYTPPPPKKKISKKKKKRNNRCL